MEAKRFILVFLVGKGFLGGSNIFFTKLRSLGISSVCKSVESGVVFEHV